jgi:hypothetical protein
VVLAAARAESTRIILDALYHRKHYGPRANPEDVSYGDFGARSEIAPGSRFKVRDSSSMPLDLLVHGTERKRHEPD